MGPKGRRPVEESEAEQFEQEDELGYEDPDKFEITDDPEIVQKAFKTQSFLFPLLRRTGIINEETGKEIVARFFVEYVQLSWDRLNSIRHGKKLPKNLKRINAPFQKEMTLPVLQAGIKYIVLKGNKYPAEIIDGEDGSTDLERGILNFNDLFPGQVKELEDLIAPGANKIGGNSEKRAVSADRPNREAVRETAL